jgi:hypothetical protein
LAVVEKNQGGLSFINLDGSQSKYSLSSIESTKVLSIDYCDETRTFGVLLSTHSVIFIEDGEIQKVHPQNKFMGSEVDIVKLHKHNLWMLISLDGTIQIFKPVLGRAQNQDK